MAVDSSLFDNIKHLWGIIIKQQPAQINLIIGLSSSTVTHGVQMNEEYFFPRWIYKMSGKVTANVRVL